MPAVLANPDYYSSVAQVIPVLLLVLAFEVGGKQHRKGLMWSISLTGSVALIAAEVATLSVLNHGSVRGAQDAVIQAGLIVGLATLMLEVAIRRLRLRAFPSTTSDLAVSGVVVVALTLFTLMALGVDLHV